MSSAKSVELTRIGTKILDAKLEVNPDLSDQEALMMAATVVRMWIDRRGLSREEFIRVLQHQPGGRPD